MGTTKPGREMGISPFCGWLESHTQEIIFRIRSWTCQILDQGQHEINDESFVQEHSERPDQDKTDPPSDELQDLGHVHGWILFQVGGCHAEGESCHWQWSVQAPGWSWPCWWSRINCLSQVSLPPTWSQQQRSLLQSRFKTSFGWNLGKVKVQDCPHPEYGHVQDPCPRSTVHEALRSSPGHVLPHPSFQPLPKGQKKVTPEVLLNFQQYILTPCNDF